MRNFINKQKKMTRELVENTLLVDYNFERRGRSFDNRLVYLYENDKITQEVVFDEPNQKITSRINWKDNTGRSDFREYTQLKFVIWHLKRYGM
jgi:hypothetical protein